MTYCLDNNLRNDKRYTEVILLNNYKETLEKEYKEFNKKTKAKRRVDGFFFNTEDGNIYLNDFMRNSYSSGWAALKIFDYSSLESHLRFSECVFNSNWKDIYEHTKFLIKTKNSEAWFSFQFIPKEKEFLSRNFAIISAENANMTQDSKEDNQKNNDLLSQILNEKKYENYLTIATLAKHTENCYIVYDIKNHDAINLAKKFNQESIFINENSTIKIIKCSNSFVEIEKDLKNFNI